MKIFESFKHKYSNHILESKIDIEEILQSIGFNQEGYTDFKCTDSGLECSSSNIAVSISNELKSNGIKNRLKGNIIILQDKYLKENNIITESISDALNLDDNEILIGINEGYYSWEDFSSSVKLYLILNTETKKLRLIFNKWSKDFGINRWETNNYTNINNDIGTINKPKISEINKIMKDNNHTASSASSTMKVNKWTLYIDDKEVEDRLTIKNLLSNEKLLMKLKMSLLEIDFIE
jgi:hypothetical protein